VVGGTNAKGGSPQLYVVYGVDIDFSDSNPATSCTYTDDAVGMTAGSTDWKTTPIFSLLKSCILINGAVSAYLNEDNIDLLVGGGASDITTLGNDAMLEIGGRIGYLINWKTDTILQIKVTNNPNASGYKYDAFSLDAFNDCDKIYLGIFKGFASGGALYSSSGRVILVTGTIDNFRTAARARGAGYQQRTNGSIKLMQCLYIIYYKNLNSQIAVGMGYVKSTNTSYLLTGTTKAYGFNSEIIKASNPTYMTDELHSIKCLGIEDMWGNVWEFVDGMYIGANRELLTCDLAKNFSTSGSGYKNNGCFSVGANKAGWNSKPVGNSNVGFVLDLIAGSDSTYLCDWGSFTFSSTFTYGGYYAGNGYAGIFQEYLNTATTLATGVGGRLMFMHKEV